MGTGGREGAGIQNDRLSCEYFGFCLAVTIIQINNHTTISFLSSEVSIVIYMQYTELPLVSVLFNGQVVNFWHKRPNNSCP